MSAPRAGSGAYSKPGAPRRAASGPILVTGMPRSGTTWLARLLATAPGTALAGREPMNPRGRQYALAKTLSGWCELTDPTPKQRRALRAAYSGRTPWVYSRYGRRQWAAPLPWTRLVVKDPFAMLSLPAVVPTTGARAVLLYRHPGAALASYRRMGWTPDTDELAPIVAAHRARVGAKVTSTSTPPSTPSDGAAAEMGSFWAALYEIALDNLEGLDDVVVVSHEEIAGGGPQAGARLFAALGLRWSPAADAELAAEAGGGPSADPGTGRALHDNLGKAPRDVAEAWRRALDPDEVAVIESVTADVRTRIDAARLRLADG